MMRMPAGASGSIATSHPRSPSPKLHPSYKAGVRSATTVVSNSRQLLLVVAFFATWLGAGLVFFRHVALDESNAGSLADPRAGDRAVIESRKSKLAGGVKPAPAAPRPETATLEPPALATKTTTDRVDAAADNSHDEPHVASRLKYWRTPSKEVEAGLWRLPESDRYVLFLSDCGGFNNIRMAFEYFVMVAWLTRRTLVLPPPHGWYLIDFGPMAVMKPEPSDDRVTDYGDFFSLEHMRAGIPVITADDFRKREEKRLNLPEKLVKADFSTKSGRKEWDAYILSAGDAAESSASFSWNPLSKVIYWPSVEEVTTAWRKIRSKDPGVEKTYKDFVHHRAPVEFTPELRDKRVLAFPSCKRGDDDARYLGQISTFALFPPHDPLKFSYKRALRDFVHFPPIVFEIAAKVVAQLGLFRYAAMHVRRNELQYKEVFLSAANMHANIKPLLLSTEPIYLATDETNPSFFADIEASHLVYKWDDFFTAKGGNVLTGVKIPRKLIGCIEQVICSGARSFFGTLESTFTGYIFRLRGYVDAPNKEIYFHTLKYSGDVESDRRVTWSKKPEKGQMYQSEWRAAWEDAVLPTPPF